jgi:hypothetical protein
LKSIYPDKKIFCYLIYTDDNKIEVVQWEKYIQYQSKQIL